MRGSPFRRRSYGRRSRRHERADQPMAIADRVGVRAAVPLAAEPRVGLPDQVASPTVTVSRLPCWRNARSIVPALAQ